MKEKKSLKANILDFLNKYQSALGYDDAELSKILGHKKNVIRRVKVEEKYQGSEQLLTHLRHFFQLALLNLENDNQSQKKEIMALRDQITTEWRPSSARFEVRKIQIETPVDYVKQRRLKKLPPDGTPPATP